MDVARQAPLSMGFSRHEYWTGLPGPPPGDRPNPGISNLRLQRLLHGRQILYRGATGEAPGFLLLEAKASCQSIREHSGPERAGREALESRAGADQTPAEGCPDTPPPAPTAPHSAEKDRGPGTWDFMGATLPPKNG